MHFKNVLTIARVATATIAALLTVGTTQAQSLTWENYNAIIFGNVTNNNKIEGRTAIGGNLTTSQSFSLGSGLNGAGNSDKSFILGGSLGGGSDINLEKGSFYLGGTNSSNRRINYNGGSGAGLVSQTNNVAALKTSYISESANFRGLATNSVATTPSASGQNSPAVFNATPGSNGVAVFSISADALFSNSKVQEIQLIANGATNVVINVSGTSVDFSTSGNMGTGFNTDYWQSHVVWNFYEATSINLNSKAFYGAILAPNATVSGTGGQIEGSVIANSLNYNGTILLPTANNATAYAGLRLQAVPEPGSPLLVLVAGMIFLLRRPFSSRRRA